MYDEIWKYPLSNGGLTEVMMPEGAEILSVQMQGMQVYVWARVNPRKPTVARTIRCFGTGFSVKSDGKFLGTVVASCGDAWHYFVEPD